MYNRDTMATNLRKMLLTGLCFVGTVITAHGYACTYRGQGSSTCRLGVVQDVWLEKALTNYNGQSYLIVGNEKNYPLKRSLLQFEDLDAANDCTTVRFSIAVAVHLKRRSVAAETFGAVASTALNPAAAATGYCICTKRLYRGLKNNYQQAQHDNY